MTMEIRYRIDGRVLSETAFRLEHSDVSFTNQGLDEATLDRLGADKVYEGLQPTLVPPYQCSQRDGVEEINGQWFTRYIAGPIFTEYTDDDSVVHTPAEQWEAYCFQKDAEQAKAVRADRNKRLAECDWTQLADAPVDHTIWAAYRQDLRDVTAQAGFPWDITWPEQP